MGIKCGCTVSIQCKESCHARVVCMDRCLMFVCQMLVRELISSLLSWSARDGMGAPFFLFS